MEYKKIVRLLSVIIFSLIMSNSVLGADGTHTARMEEYKMALAASQAALQEHREKFSHLQKAANEAHGLHQREVGDLVAQILEEKHGKGHVPTATEIALANIKAHIEASQKLLIDYSDLPPVAHSPEPIVDKEIDDKTQKYLADLAEFYQEEKVLHDNQTLKEFVRRNVINSRSLGIDAKRQMLVDFYKKELEVMQKDGVNQEFIEQFQKDINALFDEIESTYQVVPGMALALKPAAPVQGVSRSSSAASSIELDPLDAQMHPVAPQESRKASSVYTPDDDGDSFVVFDGNRGNSSALNSPELHTPDSQRYFSPIPVEPQESRVASPFQDASRSSSAASQSEQSASDNSQLVPSSDSEGEDSDNDEDDEGQGINAYQIYQSLDKSQTTEQQLQQAKIIFQKLLETPQYKGDRETIQEMHTDVTNMINKKFEGGKK